VLNEVMGVDLSAESSPSLVMSDLSEFTTLPFLAAFDVIPLPTAHADNLPTKVAPKRVTYIALSKKTMPTLVDLYMQFKDKAEIYIDGTLESVLSVCISLKLSYRAGIPSPCPLGLLHPNQVEV
jgi:hypothetical protein